MVEPIKIVDVILTKDYFGRLNDYKVVVDRMPEFVYSAGEFEKTAGWGGRGRHLIACDSGFYDCLLEVPGSTDAFAGRKFTINLDDGSKLECHGQVWDAAHPNPPEPYVQVGVATLEKLRECYVFFGGRISKAKLEAWLASNKPSQNYRKYDPQHTVAWLDEFLADHHYGDRPVCAARARKLKKRGVTIRKRGEARTWSPWYERRKAEIERNNALDPQP
ncbi:hypothetical protein [Metapseudomonas otitidis]|uniref:hypothetical protein n=1 Tax=Metapseudomonas otitidis TaxID=319939 RepID=UPI001AAF508B|nr:hypothetical protein [Pseudomonas otitidis]MBO2926682.1 hypothetical protein [Pseudomonas otitidis]